MYFVYHPKPYLVAPNAQVGLGLLCLATYAKLLGADVRVINAQRWDLQRTVAAVLPDTTVCMGGCLVDRPILDAISVELRAKGCYVAVGGPVADSVDLGPIHPTVVVQGAGEPFLDRFVTDSWRPKGRIEAPYVVDYRGYPPPDRTLLEGEYGENIYHPKANRQTPVSTTLLTTRGCRYNCAFCRSGSRRREYFQFALARISAELKQIEELGIRDVRIADDNLLANPTRLAAICGLLQEYGMKWRASVRTYPNEPSLYRTMADCGCREVNLGVESADPAVLKAIRKGSTVESNDRAVANALESGIPSVRALMMMGTPGETAKTAILNKDWAWRHPSVTVCLASLVPFPGTAIFENPGRFGCRVELDLSNPNFYAYQGGGIMPRAHVGIIGGMSRDELTRQLLDFRGFLEKRGQINHG